MFGYLKPYGINTSAENLLYKNYYCSLCHALWNYYGFHTRLLLSYDLTFICVLLKLDLESIDASKCYEKTVINKESKSWKFVAALSLLLVYAKLNDDIIDEHSFKAKIVSLLYKKTFLRAANDYPEVSKMINSSFEEFNTKEKNNSDIYELSTAFSNIMLDAIRGMFNCSEYELAVLRFVSKWVYFIDAVDDIESDIKYGHFNPFSKIANSKKQLLAEHNDYVLGFINDLSSELKPAISKMDKMEATSKLISSVLEKSIPYVSYCVFTEKNIPRKTFAMKAAERNGINYV